YRCVIKSNRAGLTRVAELAAAFRGTSEFALESSQQAAACLTTLRQVWPHHILDLFVEMSCRPVLAVVLGARSASEQIQASVALPAFLHSYVANLILAGVKLIPLGQTEGQLAVSALEDAVLSSSARGCCATLDDLGSAGFVVELASIAHEGQYTRLFRS